MNGYINPHCRISKVSIGEEQAKLLANRLFRSGWFKNTPEDTLNMIKSDQVCLRFEQHEGVKVEVV